MATRGSHYCDEDDALPFLILSQATVLAAPPRADLVLLHGRVYTQDSGQPWAQAVAIRGGRLEYVGTDREAAALAGPGSRVVDLGGKCVLPAFHDAHVHPIASGVELGLCNLIGAETPDEVLARVRAYVQAHPDRRWVVGSGWDLTLFPAANPQKRVLDTVVPDRPAVLWSADGHSAWANSIALRLAGIGRGTPDPVAGRIERDPATGDPTGTLREAAVDLVGAMVPPPTAQELERGLSRAQDILAGYGIVSVQEASAGEDFLATYAAAARSGRLKLRVRAAMSFEEAAKAGAAPAAGDLGQAIAVLRSWRERYRGPGFEAAAVKLFVDGVIEARTAVLLDAYLADSVSLTGDSAPGTPTYRPDRLAAIVAALDGARFQVHMHAIGDGAVRMALDAVDLAQRTHGRRNSRHVLAHLELIDRADLSRFASLGIIPAIQPLWAYPDEYITTLTAPVLGPDRTGRVYPFASLRRAGAQLAGGSDWSVSSPDPLQGIQVAVTRQDPGSDVDAAVLDSSERLSLPQAIEAYTLGAARANFEETHSGSLTTGKFADLVVLDGNPFEVPLRRIGRISALWTLREGHEIFRSPAWTPLPVPGAKTRAR